MDLQFNKTRIAPTPSGYLHRGNVFSFLLTRAIAEQTGAKLLLRIDDLDTARVRKEFLENIFETVSMLGIPIQEGPQQLGEYESRYSQLHRMPFYKNALMQLIQKGLVYACVCSRTTGGRESCPCRTMNIPFTLPGAALRMRTGDAKMAVRTIRSGNIDAVLPVEMQDFIVWRKDGMPAYQLASVVDDIYFGVDLVVRGDDLWASTLAQLYLAEQLEAGSFLNTVFYHHELERDERGEKLSKSVGGNKFDVNELERVREKVQSEIGNL